MLEKITDELKLPPKMNDSCQNSKDAKGIKRFHVSDKVHQFHQECAEENACLK